MERMYQGNHPEPHKGWRIADRLSKLDGVEWLLYEQDQPHTHEWKNYKIVADGAAPSKANYWMAKNIVTGQLGFSRDLAAMRTTRPGLHAQVERFFVKRMQESVRLTKGD